MFSPEERDMLMSFLAAAHVIAKGVTQPQLCREDKIILTELSNSISTLCNNIEDLSRQVNSNIRD